MRLYNNSKKLNKLNIQPHSVIFSWTSERDYEMERKILLEYLDGLEYGEYLLLEGSHCSCYDFDEIEWYAMVYEKDELLKLAELESYPNDMFWNMIKKYFHK